MNKHCETGCNVLFIGIRIKLENGLNGFIPKDNLLTDKKENIREKLQIGTVINARIVSVNEKKFNVELSYKSDDTLGFKHGEKGRDTYYDTFSEKEDMYNLQEKKNRLSNRVMYHKKLIVHPLFKNVTFDEAENLLKQKEELDCVIRPSSKGVDKLSLSIKIIDDIIVHVDIKEEEKANDYSLGKKLYIQNELYEDLDEIYASYVTPYLNYFAEVTKHKNYLFVSESDEEVIQNELKKQMTETPGGTPYLISISRSYPGKIFLAYFHKSKVQFQYVSISNHGFSIKNIAHPTIESVLTWVKSSRQEARPTPSDRGKGYTPRYDSSVPPSSKFPHMHSSRSGTSMHHRTYSSSSSVHNWPR
ncbi:Transcription elongation factor SPT6 [Thelohanellus kitauei]|uniref:Transcription elongation factor SPT6 n=1 Tax=Thelohanellus kitauei TaxID=669202 RepID=A0A0C2ME23_THEKT|nr:Transcription elongation factor SPT6 [Thelohanellus kitauei]